MQLGQKLETSAEALGFFRAAVALQPRSSVVHNSLGVAFRNQRKLTEAVAAYQRAIELQPGYAVAYLNLGIVLFDLNKLREAETAIRKAIEYQSRLRGGIPQPRQHPWSPE